MAIIKCHECNKDVSSEALACPHCGNPINVPLDRKTSVTSVVLKVILVLLALGVLAVIGMCAGFSFIGSRVIDRYEKAKIEEASIQIKNLHSAVRLYKLDNGEFPETKQNLDALVHEPRDIGKPPCCYISGGYLDADTIPLDPWGNDYIYIGPDDLGYHSFRVISKGPDGELNTKDDVEIEEQL